jgi:plasmid stability protein
MTLTIDLPDEQTAALAAKAGARGLSAEQYARQVLEHELAPTVFEQGLGLFGRAEDAALLDEVVSMATRRDDAQRNRCRRFNDPEVHSGHRYPLGNDLDAVEIAVGRVIADDYSWAGFLDFASEGRVEIDPPDFTAEHAVQ